MELNNYICRAKRIDNGEWVYGYYLKRNTVQVCFSSDDPKPKHYIIYEGFCDWGLEPPLIMTEVDPDTVCKATGKIDKHENKIFENDLLLITFPISIDVASIDGLGAKKYEYQTMLGKCVADEYAGFVCINKVADQYRWWYTEDCKDEIVEVVGNIYDNADYICPTCGMPWNSKPDTENKTPCMTCGEFI